jgi:lipopolysaccharide/colanic/teichoic acid biosynthesis glycosyltransferase
MTGQPPARPHANGVLYINEVKHANGVSRGPDHAKGSNGSSHPNWGQPGALTDVLPPVVPPRTRSRYTRYLKPVVDRVGALLLTVLALPVMLAVAVAVWAELGSPVLIRQQRVGRGGRVFGMLKFRTMRPDRRRAHHPVPPHEERRQTHKSESDPRHTRVGRFLRRRSLDELPQLLNVLAGQMSLVGPRPELEEIVSTVYESWQLQRHVVKPGITGLWQVTARVAGDAIIHNNAQIDIEYIHQLSLWTDLRILLKTPTALGKGT